MNEKSYCGHLSQFYPKNRCNWLLVGSSGSGVSSIINTMKSTKEFPETQEAEIRRTRNERCTKKIKRHSFNEFVSMYDSWGWVKGGSSHGDYSDSDFEQILIGSVDDGHEMHEPFHIGDEIKNENMMDGVIFVYGHSGNLSKMNKLYHIAIKRNLPVFVAVTKIDMWYSSDVDPKSEGLLLERDPRRAMDKVLKSSHYQELLRRIHLEVGRVTVLPIINYTHNDYTTNPVISLMAEQFCIQLTEEMKRHFSQPEQEQRSHERANASLNLSDKLFHQENPIQLIYSERLTGIGGLEDVETFIDGGDDETFALYEVYYNIFRLGLDRWRFFAVDSNVLGFCRLFGLWNPDKQVYFETMSVMSLEHIRRSFNNERSAQKYCFLGESESTKSGVYVDDITNFVRVSFAGDRGLTMKKREMKNFQISVLNKIGLLKEKDRKRKIFREEIKLCQKKHEREKRKMKEQVERLKDKVGRLGISLEHE